MSNDSTPVATPDFLGDINNIFIQNLADSGHSKTFLIFVSDDPTADATADFLGDINIR